MHVELLVCAWTNHQAGDTTERGKLSETGKNSYFFQLISIYLSISRQVDTMRTA